MLDDSTAVKKIDRHAAPLFPVFQEGLRHRRPQNCNRPWRRAEAAGRQFRQQPHVAQALNQNRVFRFRYLRRGSRVQPGTDERLCQCFHFLTLLPRLRPQASFFLGRDFNCECHITPGLSHPKHSTRRGMLSKSLRAAETVAQAALSSHPPACRRGYGCARRSRR